jgi:hypothetical protein
VLSIRRRTELANRELQVLKRASMRAKGLALNGEFNRRASLTCADLGGCHQEYGHLLRVEKARAQRGYWARDPKVQERRRQILEKWREEGLGV